MNDREFINMVIDSYLSYATDPHMATLNNTVANKLNDIADKLEKQGKVLSIIKEKNVDIWLLKSCLTVELYNYSITKIDNCSVFNLTQEEFNTLKEWVENEKKN